MCVFGRWLWNPSLIKIIIRTQILASMSFPDANFPKLLSQAVLCLDSLYSLQSPRFPNWIWDGCFVEAGRERWVREMSEGQEEIGGTLRPLTPPSQTLSPSASHLSQLINRHVHRLLSTPSYVVWLDTPLYDLSFPVPITNCIIRKSMSTVSNVFAVKTDKFTNVYDISRDRIGLRIWETQLLNWLVSVQKMPYSVWCSQLSA